MTLVNAAVLFDLDGTLVDTETAHQNVIHQVLHQRDIRSTRHDLLSCYGQGYTHTFQYVMQLYKRVEFDPSLLAEEARLHFLEHVGSVKLFPYAHELLLTMRGLCHHLALVTTSWHSGQQAICEAAGIDTMFDVIITGDQTKNHKPHPEPYQKAIAQLNTRNPKPDLYIAVEDTVAGLQSAQNAGCMTIGVAHTISLHDIFDAGADYAASNLEAVACILHNSILSQYQTASD